MAEEAKVYIAVVNDGHTVTARAMKGQGVDDEDPAVIVAKKIMELYHAYTTSVFGAFNEGEA